VVVEMEYGGVIERVFDGVKDGVSIE